MLLQSQTPAIFLRAARSCSLAASCTALFLALLAGPALGATIASHVGATDPTTEGWTQSATGNFGPVFNDGTSMLDAWFTDQGGGDVVAIYEQDLTSAAAGLAGGWTYSIRLRLADLSDPVDFGVSAQFEANGRAYAMIFGSDAVGNVTVRLPLGGGSSVGDFIVPGGVDDYHLYEFIENDTSDLDIDFAIDGVVVDSSYFGVPSFLNRVFFGDASTTAGSGGRGHFAEVTLSTVPEPAMGLLLLTGLGALMSRVGARSTDNS